MSRPVRYLWLSFAAGAFLTLAAPGAARASCGHYVVIGNPRDDQATRAAMPEQLDGSVPDTPSPSGPPKPCFGPHCSANPEPITPPPAPRPLAEEDRWGSALAELSLPSPGSDSLFLARPSARPVRGAPSIYHPPR